MNLFDFSLSDTAHQAPQPLQPADLASFALEPDAVPVVKAIAAIPVRKPPKDSFVRTHPDIEWWKAYLILDHKSTQTTYLILPAVLQALTDTEKSCVTYCHLVLTVDRHGNHSLWPVKISDRPCNWHTSAFRGAQIAKEQWVRMVANMQHGQYNVLVALNQTPAPVWPTESHEEILAIAFADLVIREVDHPVLRELRGE